MELMQQLLAVREKIKILKQQQHSGPGHAHSGAGHAHIQYAPPPSEHHYTKLLHTASRHMQPHCACHFCQQQQPTQQQPSPQAPPAPPPRGETSLPPTVTRRTKRPPDAFFTHIPNSARDNIYWEVEDEPNATTSSLDWSQVEPYGGNPTLEQPSQCSSQWSSVHPDQSNCSSLYPDQSSCSYDPDRYPRDQLSQLEQELESSMAELSTIMYQSDSTQLQLYSSFRPCDMSLLGHLPRQSTPRFLQDQPQDPSMQQPQFIFHEHDNPYHQEDISQQHYQYPQPSSTTSQDSLQVAQPASSGEQYSDYVQELAQESTLEDSSVLTFTFSSPTNSTLIAGPSPPHTSLRPPCVGQEESPTAARDPSTYVPGGEDPTYVNLSPDSPWLNTRTLPESPGQSIATLSQPSSPVPSSANSDATSFMDRDLAPQPVTFKIKASRYHAVKKCLTNVGRQIKKRGPKSGGLKTFAIL